MRAIWIVALAVFVAAQVCEASLFKKVSRGIGAKMGQIVVTDTKRNESKIILKRLLVDKQLTQSDLINIRNFLKRKTPKSSNRTYKNIITEIGWRLIDPDLTVKDYDEILKFFNGMYKSKKDASFWRKLWGAFGWYEQNRIFANPGGVRSATL